MTSPFELPGEISCNVNIINMITMSTERKAVTTAYNVKLTQRNDKLPLNVMDNLLKIMTFALNIEKYGSYNGNNYLLNVKTRALNLMS